MKAKRIQLLIAMVLLLIGIAGVVHTALEQSQAHASSAEVIAAEASIAELEANVSNIAAMPRIELQSGDSGMPDAPVPPTPPPPPVMSNVVVDPWMWLGLTAACFTPFALLGWYLDQRTGLVVYEQPLA